MTLNQLKELPSVSQVIFEIDKNILLNNKYIPTVLQRKKTINKYIYISVKKLEVKKLVKLLSKN